MAVKVIIDTDIGSDVDDAIALAFALRRSELAVAGLTTVYGPVDKRGAILAKLLRVLGREEVPYALGEALPIGPVTPERHEQTISEQPNQFPFVRPGDALRAPAFSAAEELILAKIQEHPGEVWLACIGPLTNAARLIQRHPREAAQLRGIVCMGGEPHHPRKEYNVLCDPEAARVVFRSGLLRYQGTWDITRRVAMTDANMAALEKSGTPLGAALTELTRLWLPFQTWKKWPVVYDMCPLAWLFAPALFKTERLSVDVELTGELTRGMTIPVPQGPKFEVTTGAQDQALLDLLMETLLRP